MGPKLSVVVPFYNVEEYIDECLASVARQTLEDLEVILVDDGSRDGSLAVAEGWVAKDERFRLVRQENQGLGPARNTGVRHAEGEYLAFLDSDDVVPRKAYELLVSSLERSGSDLASGNALRFNSRGTFPFGVHKGIFDSTRRGTDVLREPALLRDRVAWNKVFRLSFWRENGFEFPPGYYEDTPVIVPAYVQAGRVDVLKQVVYHYREREGDNASITQRRAEIENLRARVLSVTGAREAVGRSRFPGLQREYDSAVLVDDFWVFMRILPQVTEEYREAFAQEVLAYVDGIDPTILDELPLAYRLQYWLLRAGRMAELLEVLRHGRALTGVVRHDGRWYGDFPYLRDTEVGVPDEIYRVDEELTLRTTVTDLRWRSGRLHMKGYAAIRYVGAPTLEENRIRLWIRHTRLGLRRRLPVRQFADPVADVHVPEPREVRWAAFETVIDPRRLGVAVLLGRGSWEVVVEVSGQGLVREGTLSTFKADEAPALVGAHPMGNTVRVLPTFRRDGRFLLRVGRGFALLRRDWVEGDRWNVECELPRGCETRDLVLGLFAESSSERLTEPMAVHKDEGGRKFLRASVPLAELFPERPRKKGRGAGRTGWEARVLAADGDSGQWNLVAPSGFGEHRSRADRGEVVTALGANGGLLLITGPPSLVVRRFQWAENGVLCLTGDFTGTDQERPAEVELRRRASHHARRLPLMWRGDVFTLEVDPVKIPAWGTEVSLNRGRWDFKVLSADGRHRPVRINRPLIGTGTTEHRSGGQRFVILPRHGDEMSLSVRANHVGASRSALGRKKLREGPYVLLREQPLRDTVLFQSYAGAQYSCNPRAIHNELRARETGLDLVWVTLDGSLRPPGVRTVLMGGEEHTEALATARAVVSNCGIQDWYVKREDQFYFQTWHGSPLKKVGMDAAGASFSQARKRMERLLEDSRKWDVLLSQSAFTTPILRRAMDFGGEVAELGYPRNDALYAPDAVDRGRQVRGLLGIAPEKRVVLYAPTWRDDGNTAGNTYHHELQLDLERMREKLGDDHVVLLRLHHLVNRHGVIRGDGFVMDVSGYPEINDLCLAADVLVTDYSSLLVDYAGTGRPLLVYGYDYERYRDLTRGLAVDLEEYGPGPVLRDTDEVIEALADLEGYQERYRSRYEEFRKEFCPHEDGSAAARAADLVLRRIGARKT